MKHLGIYVIIRRYHRELLVGDEIGLTLYGGFLKWGIPNSWLVYFMEHPNLKWMMTGGTGVP